MNIGTNYRKYSMYTILHMHPPTPTRPHSHTSSHIIHRVDKKRAEDGQWRVTEKELFVYGAIGGAIGGWSAMWVYRHKTSKRRFCLPYLFMFLFDLVVLILLVALVIIIPAIYK